MLRQALVLLPLVLAIAGCTPAYQARYIPTSVDEVFGPFSHVGGIESQVYELPAAPPATLNDDIRPRPCRRPGQLMKPTPMVAFYHEMPYSSSTGLTPMAHWQEPGMKSPPPMKTPPLAGWDEHLAKGVKEPLLTTPFDPQSRPGTSLEPGLPTRLGAYRTDQYSWCDEDANLR